MSFCGVYIALSISLFQVMIKLEYFHALLTPMVLGLHLARSASDVESLPFDAQRNTNQCYVAADRDVAFSPFPNISGF